MPSASTKKASLIIGTRMRLTTKPGAFFTVIGVLPSAWRKRLHRVVRGVAGLQAADDSTSAIIGTGLKKCMPMKRSGAMVAAASLVIEIDEVLVAMSTSRRQRRAELLQDLELELLVLGRGLDDQFAAGELRVVGGRP